MDPEGVVVLHETTPEGYFREHAARLRRYARYTNPKASEQLIESARFLEWQVDRFRDRSLAEAKRDTRRWEGANAESSGKASR